jgi:hypothetical protein
MKRAGRRGTLLTSGRIVGLALVVALLAMPADASADSGGATIRRLPESEQLQVSAEVHHQCSGTSPTEAGGSCPWFAQASEYPASTACPIVFDVSHSVWTGPVETYAGTTFGTFAFNPRQSSGAVQVCLYVYSEGSSLVGQSHPFDLNTGREILPAPPSPPPTPEPSLAGMRYCEHPALNGAFLAATPDVSCRTARSVRHRLFENPCQNRTYCAVLGFRCYGRWEGRLRPFSYAHHASCRSGHRRILLDTG